MKKSNGTTLKEWRAKFKELIPTAYERNLIIISAFDWLYDDDKSPDYAILVNYNEQDGDIEDYT